MDAFLANIQPLIAYRPGAALGETLRNALSDLARALDRPRRDLLRHLLSAAQSDPELARAFQDNWIRPRREEGHRAIEAAGVPREESDVMPDLLFGAFYYRMLIPYAEIDDKWIRALVRRVAPDEPLASRPKGPPRAGPHAVPDGDRPNNASGSPRPQSRPLCLLPDVFCRLAILLYAWGITPGTEDRR